MDAIVIVPDIEGARVVVVGDAVRARGRKGSKAKGRASGSMIAVVNRGSKVEEVGLEKANSTGVTTVKS